MPSDTPENRKKIGIPDTQYDYGKAFKTSDLPKSVFIDGFEWLVDVGNPMDVHPGGAFQKHPDGRISPALLARKAELEQPYEKGDDYAIDNVKSPRYNIGKPKWKTKIYEYKKGWLVILKRVPDIPPDKDFPLINLRFEAVPPKDDAPRKSRRVPMLDPHEDTVRGGPKLLKRYDKQSEDEEIAESY